MRNLLRHTVLHRSDASLRIRALDRVLFAKRLALYLRAGIPLLESLALLSRYAKKGSYRRILIGVYASVQKGKPLSQSLHVYSRSFTSLHVQLIAVGEIAGTLPETLSYLAEVLSNNRHLRRDVVAALMYPAILLFGAITVSGFLIFYAFPKIIPLFRGLHTQLPLPTRVLIALSHNWLTILIVIVITVAAIILLGFIASRKTVVRYSLHTALLVLPGLGSVIQSYNLALLFRLLSVMQQSGARIDVTLGIMHSAWRNEVYKTSLVALEQTVLAGGKIATGLKRFPRAYPAVVIELIAAGEETGSLAQSARTVADLYRDQLQEDLTRMSTLLEPLLLLCMGMVVGFVALAIISPIYSLTQSLSTH